jgi:uncharacterized membrane-anchored protein
LYGYVFELHLDAPDGKLLSTADLLPDPKNIMKMNFVSLNYSFSQPITDGHFHDLYIVDRPKDEKENQEMKLDALKIQTKYYFISRKTSDSYNNEINLKI